MVQEIALEFHRFVFVFFLFVHSLFIRMHKSNYLQGNENENQHKEAIEKSVKWAENIFNQFYQFDFCSLALIDEWLVFIVWV